MPVESCARLEINEVSVRRTSLKPAPSSARSAKSSAESNAATVVSARSDRSGYEALERYPALLQQTAESKGLTQSPDMK